MGFFKRVGQSLGLSGNDAGRRSSKEFQRLSNEGIAAINQAQGDVAGSLGPLTDLIGPNLSALQDTSTIDGFTNQINSILESGALDSLIENEQRAVNSQLGAVGLRRSGAGVGQIAAIPQQLAFSLESLLRGRTNDLFGTGVNALGALNTSRLNSANNIANIKVGQAANASNGILTDARADATGIGNLFGALSAGASAFGGSGFAGDGKSAKLLSALSDRRLKTNVERIGEFKGLNVYKWDWVKGAEFVGDVVMNVGFMSQEVQKVFPQHVEEKDGALFIDYHSIMEAA